MELYIDFIYLSTQILQVTFKQGQGPFSISAHTLVPFPGLVPCMHIYPSHIAPQVTTKSTISNRESHPRARERTHIPERIGLCGPLSGSELYHHVALHHSMGCYLVVKSATRPNKASNMACHNGKKCGHVQYNE